MISALYAAELKLKPMIAAFTALNWIPIKGKPKYKINKKNLTEEEYMDGFYKAKKNDGQELIAREYEKNNSQREKIVY